MLRSECMTICEMYVAPEAAFDTLQTLGEMCCVQFLDNNEAVPAFQRNYVAEMCRCTELERKLLYMEREMLKDGIVPPKDHVHPKAVQANEMLELENLLEQWEQEILEVTNNQTKIMKNFLELTEMYYVLKYTEPIIGNSEILRGNKFNQEGGPLGTGSLFVYTGVVMRVRCYALETMLWRVSRGNIHFRHADRDKILNDPFTGQPLRKVAFVVVGQGHELSKRVQKVCNGFKVNLYPCPQNSDDRADMLQKLDVRLADIEQVMKKTSFHRKKALATVSRTWHLWYCQVRKAKSIYHHLNLFDFDITKKCLIGKCWIPDHDLTPVQNVLQNVLLSHAKLTGTGVHSFLSKITTRLMPPTFFRTNKFTRGFQQLVDAYGDAGYRELNPGLYTIVTFPFLFAVMFGDIGHGFIMAVFAWWMIKNEKQSEEEGSDNEIWNIFFAGRYILFLMGIFSIFTGFIYNDIFSKGFVLGAPGWYSTYTVADLQTDAKTMPLNAFTSKGQTGSHGTYWFGVSPGWKVAKNKMVFENSLKMKLSIIIGVVHMIFGIVLSLFNHLHFRHRYAIYVEFIPQLLFLCCLFLYLVFMIYYKWFKYSMYSGNPKENANCAPLLLIYFIDMFLLSESKPVAEGCDAYMYPGQRMVQAILLIVALLCVPILLFGAPLAKKKEHKKKNEELQAELRELKMKEAERPPKANVERITASPQEVEILAELERYPLYGDMQINQAVHTIEFCLSTISHTASYLRLWALSLAHAQLSEMLWEMILSKIGLHDKRPLAFFKLFLVFAIWAVFTITIMVVMEALSAFLHTLRLHWVEFMSKFFMGGGYPFRPFCFKVMLETVDLEDKNVNVCQKRAKAQVKWQEKRLRKQGKMKKL